MRFSLITLFPEMFYEALETSIIGRAAKKKLITIEFIQLRDYALDSYKTVDGKPYGGGSGMILRVDVIDRALTKILRSSRIARSQTRIILTDPRGARLVQKTLSALATYTHIIIIAGHYEGVDERAGNLVDEKISLGDFILTGGEIPSMAIIDGVARLIPGVIRENAATDESFSEKQMHEYPQYTEPREYQGMKVPEVLLSGNHKKIEEWKKDNST